MMFSAIYLGGGELTVFGNEQWFVCLFWIKMLRQPKR